MEYKPKLIKPRNFIKIGQANLSGSRVATDEIRQIMYEKSIDVLLLQEPYSLKGKIVGFGIKPKVIESIGRMPSATINKIQAGIVVANPHLTVTKLQRFSNTHFTCVQICSTNLEMILVSAYFQFSESITVYLEYLDAVLLALHGKKIIIGIDANANSSMWHSHYTDNKGQELEEFILQHNLVIVNAAGQPSTFQNVHGKSNIDITMTTANCERQLSNWKVNEGFLASGDHRVITYDLSISPANRWSYKIPRYLVSKANWNLFDSVLLNRLGWEASDYQSKEAIGGAVSCLEESIIKACDVAIPSRAYYSASVPWWTPDLTILKHKVNKIRKKFQKAVTASVKERLRRTYREARRAYHRDILKAKRLSWQKFATQIASGNPWSLIYKLQTDKYTLDGALNTVQLGGLSTVGWRESREQLLNVLIPDDDINLDTDAQKELRANVELPPADFTVDTPPFILKELTEAANRTKNRKAPGIDNIEPEVAKRVVSVVGPLVLSIFNACLEQGVFPERWKYGVVRVLLKGQDRDPADVKSYRPVCLLPVLSKILERVMIMRLDNVFNNQEYSSPRQFGFKSGKSTEDAIVTMRQLVSNATQKYVIALFFDISGAFDNVWWPSVLNALKMRRCPHNVYKLVQSYLSERKVKVIESAGEVSKIVTKGCPQGSVLGPYLWNLIFDQLLNLICEWGFEPVAYADDLAVVIQGCSRMNLQQKAQDIVTKIESWCQDHKLRLSPTKTEMVLLKGILDIRRPPTVKVGGTSLRFSENVRYLGVRFGQRLNIGAHVSFVCAKSKMLFYKLSQVSRKNWGIRYKDFLVIYKGLFIPIITYAASGWIDRLTVKLKNKILTTQRQVLIYVTKAYRTVSGDALLVLTGSPPMDLLLSERAALYNLKRQKEIKHGNLIIEPRSTLNDSDRKDIARQIREQTILLWQDRWDRSMKARVTYDYMPSIDTAISSKWIFLNYYTTQALTGHGNFSSKLFQLKLSNTPNCNCGMIDTVQHLLFDCPLFENERRLFRGQIRGLAEWPCNLTTLVIECNFEHYARYIKCILKKKENSGRIE